MWCEADDTGLQGFWHLPATFGNYIEETSENKSKQ